MSILYFGLVGRQEGPHLLGLEDVDDLEGVREIEGVENDHDGEHHRFGDLERLHDRVLRLLVALAVDLEPAGVALREGVVLVGPDAPRRADRAVDVHQHDRKPGPDRPMDDLVHEEKPLRRGRREGPHAGRGSADARGERAVLGLDRDELRVELPLGAHLGEKLHDLRLGSYRVRGDHLDVAGAHAVAHGVVTHDNLLHLPSSRVEMALRGHSVTQTRQPLQKVVIEFVFLGEALDGDVGAEHPAVVAVVADAAREAAVRLAAQKLAVVSGVYLAVARHRLFDRDPRHVHALPLREVGGVDVLDADRARLLDDRLGLLRKHPADALGGLAPRRDRLDHARRARHDVSPREDLLACASPRIRSVLE